VEVGPNSPGGRTGVRLGARLALGKKSEVAVALTAAEIVTVAVRLAAGEPVAVAVAVRVTVAVIVGEAEGLGVRLGDGEAEGEAEGVSCWKTTLGEAAKAVSQTSASDSPRTKPSPRAFTTGKVKVIRRLCQSITRFTRRRDSMLRVIILLLFYAKNIISCLIRHTNFIRTCGNRWHQWTSPPSL
jgi:hypothetical protein